MNHSLWLNMQSPTLSEYEITNMREYAIPYVNMNPLHQYAITYSGWIFNHLIFFKSPNLLDYAMTYQYTCVFCVNKQSQTLCEYAITYMPGYAFTYSMWICYQLLCMNMQSLICLNMHSPILRNMQSPTLHKYATNYFMWTCNPLICMNMQTPSMLEYAITYTAWISIPYSAWTCNHLLCLNMQSTTLCKCAITYINMQSSTWIFAIP